MWYYILASEGSIVHKTCQHRYTDKKDLAKRKSSITEESTFSRKSVRLSIESPVGENLLCLFCDRTVSFDKPKDRSRLDALKIQTDDFVRTVSACAAHRCDEWSYKVKGRIEYFFIRPLMQQMLFIIPPVAVILELANEFRKNIMEIAMKNKKQVGQKILFNKMLF